MCSVVLTASHWGIPGFPLGNSRLGILEARSTLGFCFILSDFWILYRLQETLEGLPPLSLRSSCSRPSFPGVIYTKHWVHPDFVGEPEDQSPFLSCSALPPFCAPPQGIAS